MIFIFNDHVNKLFICHLHCVIKLIPLVYHFICFYFLVLKFHFCSSLYFLLFFFAETFYVSICLRVFTLNLLHHFYISILKGI